MTYSHLRADCLYTGISSRPDARYRVWKAFTFTFIETIEECTPTIVTKCNNLIAEECLSQKILVRNRVLLKLQRVKKSMIKVNTRLKL